MKRLAKLFLFITKSRYTLEIKNLPKLDPQSNYLILPNHIAYIDPVFIWCLFAPQKKLRAVATSRFSENIFLRRIFKALETITVEEISKEKKSLNQSSKKIEQAFDDLILALHNWDSVLLYPSGQLVGQGLEYLGGKKSAYLATKALKNQTKIILVRTRGLRGSIWSNAWTGGAPSLTWWLLKGLRRIIANLFFFLPKRKVQIEFVDKTEEIKLASTKSLEAFNQTLEDFYNEKGEESISYIPHYFYYNDVKNKKLPLHIRHSIQELKQTQQYDTTKFSENTVKEIIQELRRIKDLSLEEKISLESNLILDLYLDSLDMAEIKNLILNRFPDASNTPILELKTVADLVAMASWLTKSEDSDFLPCERNIPEIQQEKRDLDEDSTILEHFKKQWKANKHATQSYDSIFGLQTRHDIALKALLISDYLKEIPGKQIGIMLPAIGSVGTLILASYLAEKIPVMMNRTHPETAFDHCVKFSKTKKILTSKAFFNKLNIPRLNNYDFIFLEDLLKHIPLHRKLKALIKSRNFPLPKTLDSTAVVLYTSGSEALPKAVPLTHKNLISNLKGALQIMNIKHDERFFCYLPPFHSFGFTVNTILPLVVGLRNISTPDPNDSLTAAKLIKHTKPTLLATTPTFLRNLLNIAKPNELSSLRYVITWGEKCNEQIFEKFKKMIPHGLILEGYGITECSPIISINPIEHQKAQSVGIAIGNGEIKILDLETEEELKSNQEGMIYYSGPSVFNGYSDKSIESPFIKKGWKIWYRTGDLGYLDKDKYLYITGRKKRFLKLGGEMISLPFLENLLQKKRWNSEETNLALEGKETENWIEITLFSVDLEVSLKEVNTYLKEKGVSNLIKINAIKKIGAIPLLWSGKIDYKVLKRMV